ncbi:RNA-binding protein [Floricoccus tropicus]|uniref:RNA-binding protein n=2 Tax=Floricoccus TaxID=1930830 RepID=A0A1E8GL92_9LACT|nr:MULTISPECIES: ribosome assembly RNA-binding protein YhbY [Floricoccus]OFI47181.1 RNA-binding protein [Floricoccus penangensis]OFI48947.1 RNA-binding protein [Floricoccus tropicus]URZ87363.1 ribosome assembly RNA-binding protein YhbY [Floricoccus penangensis]
MELTSKQKSFLKSEAHHLSPIVQIGKNGMNNEVKTSIRNVLDARELIKISLLQNTDETVEDVADALEEMGFNVVQKIGRIVVVFKVSDRKENRKISAKVKAI